MGVKGPKEKNMMKDVPWNNAFWPTAVVGEADSVNSVSASACHIGGPNSVNPGKILLVYGNTLGRVSTLQFPYLTKTVSSIL